MGNELRFDGKVAVVTGAGRGLGREFALLLASRGAAVIVNDIGSSVDAQRYAAGEKAPNPAGEVVEEIIAAGGRAKANTASVADPAGAASIVDDAVEAFGRIDIVINNAAVVLTEPFATMSLDMLTTSLEVNLKGPFLVAQRAWGHMLKQGGGRILNICSVDGVVFGNVNHSAYDAAKGGLAGLTRGMAIEGAEVGIAVNGLLPGAYTRGQKSVDQSLTPVKLIDMRPELVAPAACWLVHEACGENGAFFHSSSGRLSRVFVGVGEGFQDVPEHFSMERIRDNREQAHSYEPYVSPRTTQEFNEFRVRRFREINPPVEA